MGALTSLHALLRNGPVEASAPCRIDAFGTWDIKALALPFERHGPLTVNAALNMRTHVRLHPFRDGRVRVLSEGFAQPRTARVEQLPLRSSFGLFFAAAAYFGFHGVDIRVRSESPVKSGLGGSSTALVALIQAFSKASARLGLGGLRRERILHLAYQLEDAVSGGFCGLQDQAAAVHGGVHRWEWSYGRPGIPVRRVRLLDRAQSRAFSERLLVAYSGRSHVSARTNRRWVQRFLSGETRPGWLEANRIAQNFSSALQEGDWASAAGLLRAEMKIRRRVTPEAFTPDTHRLVRQAEELHCGARFTGAGAGGALWALGPRDRLTALRQSWTRTLAAIPEARILDCRVDEKGVR